MMNKPQCCGEDMTFVMDDKRRELFECLKCHCLAMQGKITPTLVWYKRITPVPGVY